MSEQMVDQYIEDFGSKMLVDSKGINKIPYKYLSQAFNCRCTGAGIIPRLGKEILTTSNLGTKNKGGFALDGNLYQITNGKIYLIDLETGDQTEKADLGYDSRVDVIVYDFPKGDTIIVGETLTHSYTTPEEDIGTRITNLGNEYVLLSYQDGSNFISFDQFDGSGTTDGKLFPSIKVTQTGTDGTLSVFDGGGTLDGSDVLIEEDQWCYSGSTGLADRDVTVEFGYYDSSQQAIIIAKNGSIQVFDGESILDTQTVDNNGIIEYTRGYTFIATGSILRISAPITVDNPENAYNFTGTSAQEIVYDTKIVGLKGTLNGLYVFTEDKIEFLGANSLQNVAGSATFISTPLGYGGEPMSNLCITASGDQIFYLTKNRVVNTVNYISGTDNTSIGKLSNVPVIGIGNYLKLIDSDQDDSFAFYNQNEDNIQMHLKTTNYKFNNIILVYDLINQTWNIDTGKIYNYVVKLGSSYYGFGDLNSNIYEDGVTYSDNGVAIPFKIRTQAMNYGSIRQKLCGGIMIAGGIGIYTELLVNAYRDKQSIFSGEITGSKTGISGLGEIGGNVLGGNAIGGTLTYSSEINPFEKLGDEGRIYEHGTRFEIEIVSTSLIQDFIIDMLGFRIQPTNYIDINNKF